MIWPPLNRVGGYAIRYSYMTKTDADQLRPHQLGTARLGSFIKTYRTPSGENQTTGHLIVSHHHLAASVDTSDIQSNAQSVTDMRCSPDPCRRDASVYPPWVVSEHIDDATDLNPP